jgi:hypothetical protein
MHCYRRDEHHQHALLHEIADLLRTLVKGQNAMSTDQAALDDYIENTLTPALTALETQGQQIATLVNTLVADYQQAVAKGTAPDLTPQLTELQALTSRLASDTSAATTLGTQLTADLPASTPTPAAPVTTSSQIDAKKAT